ncbi:MAG: hypothetical protein M5R40_27255 [Anaerolineae bacterium]|nr:hypothetical protein [Anaerolineae bacterium]
MSAVLGIALNLIFQVFPVPEHAVEPEGTLEEAPVAARPVGQTRASGD